MIKTRAARVDAVFARVKALHGYERPAMLAIPAASGDSDYLDWVRAETP
ncbi:MAG: divalent cation tolerance protein CutA [Alphaproteobacteria bacterium]